MDEATRPASDAPRDGDSAIRRRLLWVIAAAALFWLLREAYALLMPLAAALLLALAVWPLAAGIRARVPRRLGWLGALAGTLVVLAFLSLLLAGVGYAAQSLYALALDIGPRLGERLRELPIALPGFITGETDPGAKGVELGGDLARAALTVLNMTVSTLGGIVLILFLMLLMLGEAPAWQTRVRAVAATRREARDWLGVGLAAGEKFRVFFLARLLLGIANGLLYGGFLFFFDVDYAVLWGVLAALLSFLPTVGSIISGVLPTAYVFVTRDTTGALIVAGGLLAIEQVMGNFVDPQLIGRRLSISPLVVLASLLLWTLLWGVAGAFLAVPMTVLATLVMARIEALKPAALLLTECEDFDSLEDYSRPG